MNTNVPRITTTAGIGLEKDRQSWMYTAPQVRVAEGALGRPPTQSRNYRLHGESSTALGVRRRG